MINGIEINAAIRKIHNKLFQNLYNDPLTPLNIDLIDLFAGYIADNGFISTQLQNQINRHR